MSIQSLALCLTVVFVARSGWAAQAAPAGATKPAAGTVTLQTDYVTWDIGADGRALSFRDTRTGKERLAAPGRQAVMVLRKGGANHAASTCTYADGKLTVQFPKAGATAVVKVTPRKHYLVLELASVSSPDVDEMTLLSLQVTPAKHVSWLSGVASDDEFAACVRGLNLQVLADVGGRPPVLAARCSRKYGLAGAKLAVVGCPAGEIRNVLQEVVRDEHLPCSPLGGPFALDAPENRGSYVFAYVTQKNVDAWIALAKRAGMMQIHFIGWEKSLGHYEPRADAFPDGLAGLKAAVDKIHAAGLKAGMHTLTGCIATNDPWATPVPDKRLAKDAAFTLTDDVDAKANVLPTAEPPGDFDTIWAYSGRGNVLRVGEELIHFSGLSRQAPYGFTGCRRGAFGTRPQPHRKGAAADHLFVRYACFQPDEDSTLVGELADGIANVFNTCGFDMIYMDGAEGMIGGRHGVAKMRAAIFTRLKRRALVEASEWGCESWPFHSRLGAWDYPNWGLKRFNDVHCRATVSYRESSLLPAQLGWWAVFGPDQNRDAETPDELEYLCCKALALDAPMSFQHLSVADKPENARQDEYLAMIGQYERLRLERYFSEPVRAALRQEKAEFHLVQADGGGWQFLPTDYAAHKVTGLPDETNAWTVTNRFAAQPLKLRIKALYSAEPYDSPQAVVLADFAKAGEFPDSAAAAGVTHALAPSTQQVKAGKTSGCYTATSKAASRRGAWAKAAKTFTPDLNLSKHGALGVWVHGDGRGELLNVQLTNPPQYWPTWDEHYVRVDFTGWRYFELLFRERDAEQFGDHVWPYGGDSAVYRSPLIRGHVDRLSLYFNDLPPGQGVKCFLSPIKALGVRKVKLANPSIQVGPKRLTFPVTLESGWYIELSSPSDCKVYNDRGAVVQAVQPQGEPPALSAGANKLAFTCQGPQGFTARAEVTVITHGPALGGRGRPNALTAPPGGG